MTQDQLREKAEKFADEYLTGKTYPEDVDALEQFARQIRAEALDECAEIVANEGYASRSVRAMFYDPIQALKDSQ